MFEHDSPEEQASLPPWQQTRQEMINRFILWLDIAAETEAGRERLRCVADDRTAGTAPVDVDASLASTVGAENPMSGLLDVVGSLTALRHELKLQTRSSRGLIERIDADADRLEQVAERIARSLERLPDVDAQSLRRPLMDTLVDVDEAVGRFRQALDTLAADWPPTPPPPPKTSWWGRRSVAAAWAELARIWSERHRRLVNLADGARLLANRLDDHLAGHQIIRVGRVGDAVDPHTMQVLEVVTDSEATPGTVAQVFRPGYCQGDLVIRPAQVAAAQIRV